MSPQYADLLRASAELILAWHRRHGVHAFEARWGGSDTSRYWAALEELSALDLSDARAQEAVARAQRSGALEWAYVTPLPAGWLRELAPPGLGELADRLSEAHDTLGTLAGWVVDTVGQRAESEPELRRAIRPASRAALLAAATQFYGSVLPPATPALGGASALLSCSLERTPLHESEPVQLLHPDVLGLHVVEPHEREDDLIDAVRDGELAILDVEGEPEAKPDAEPDARER